MNAKTLAHAPEVWEDEPDINEPLTPEEQEEWRVALAKATESREKWLAARGGVPFRPSWIDLAEARDERTRQLGYD